MSTRSIRATLGDGTAHAQVMTVDHAKVLKSDCHPVYAIKTLTSYAARRIILLINFPIYIILDSLPNIFGGHENGRRLFHS